MTKIGFVAVLLCCLLTTMVFADESYICVEDMAVGFKYNQTIGEWESTKFNIRNETYIVVKKMKQWEIIRVGESSGVPCEKDFNEDGFLTCGDFFSMNKNNLRYIRTDTMGYHDANINIGLFSRQDGDHSPYIAIGECHRLP